MDGFFATIYAHDIHALAHPSLLGAAASLLGLLNGSCSRNIHYEDSDTYWYSWMREHNWCMPILLNIAGSIEH